MTAPVAAASRAGMAIPPHTLPNPPVKAEPVVAEAPAAAAEPVAPRPEDLDPSSYVSFDEQTESDAPAAADSTGDEDRGLQDDGEDAAADSAEDEDEALPEDAKAENFKKLRDLTERAKQKAKVAAAKAAEVEEQLKETRSKLEQYETGLVVPDVIAEKDKRIAELEPLEKLHALKTSREYQERFIRPLTEMHTRLRELAQSYDFQDAAEIDQALNISNPAELNRYLSRRFDALGAQDARDLIRGIQNLQNQALEAQQQPAAALSKMIADSQAAEEAAARQAFQDVHAQARTAWTRALAKHKADGVLHELILDPNDESHNARYVRPTLAKAGAEYGRVVKELFANGLRKLPDELAYALAAMCQYTQAAAIQSQMRVAATEHAQAVEESARAARAFNRPPVGGGSPTAVMSDVPAPRFTPEETARKSRELAQAQMRSARK